MCRSKCEAPVVQLIEHLSHMPKEPGSNHAKGNINLFRFVTPKLFFVKIYIFQSHMTFIKKTFDRILFYRMIKGITKMLQIPY